MQISNNTNVNFGRRFCFIPKCKAICCSDVPLPEQFILKSIKENKSQRKIFHIAQIGVSEDYGGLNCVAFTNPLRYVGRAPDGRGMWEVKDGSFDDPNYCAFITNSARCSTYKTRPRICREFGTDKMECPETLSRKDYIKENIKSVYEFYKNKILSLFNK